MSSSRWHGRIVFSLGLILGATGCGHQHRPPAAQALPTARVRLQLVEPSKQIAGEDALGTVRARLRATIEAKTSGRIKVLPVVAGQRVRAGDLLVQLEAQEVQARLDQARATLQQAERDLQRFVTLRDQKAITQQEYDAVEARQRVGAAMVAEAETMLSYARITAPFDGLITRKLADVGDLASPGRALLELEDPSHLRLEADVPEALLDRIAMGARMRVRVANTNAFDAVVAEISPAVDSNSRTFRVKLDLPAAPELRVGQFGRVTVPLGESSILRVPESAIVTRGQMELVFVAQNGRAQLRLVKTGKRSVGQVEVLSGLVVGESVVVEGAAPLLDNQPLEVQP